MTLLSYLQLLSVERLIFGRNSDLGIAESIPNLLGELTWHGHDGAVWHGDDDRAAPVVGRVGIIADSYQLEIHHPLSPTPDILLVLGEMLHLRAGCPSPDPGTCA